MNGNGRNGAGSGLIAMALAMARQLWTLWATSLELTRRAGREPAE